MPISPKLEHLYSLHQFGIKLGLENITELMDKLGNPQNKLKYIHVAGSNGKGSVCVMLESILKQKYKVGKFTSPHLKRFNERITINGEEIPDKDVDRLIDLVMEKRTNQTFFEVVTAMAFVYFAEQKVDYVVLEVGLGGRLDATNIITPKITVITNISLEHTNILGETIEKIAAEKAGIIKPGIPVVTGAKEEAFNVILKICEEKESNLFYVAGKYQGELSLKGEFQKENATIASFAAKKIGMSEGEIERGLIEVEWPGRFEKKNNLILDCAHNPAGMQALVNEIKKLDYKNLIIVFGVLKDKDYKKMLWLLKPLAKEIILTKPNHPDRALDPYKMEDGLKVVEDIKTAVENAKSLAGENDLVLVTGSIFVVGEVE
jgi:dihydrofolate synthase/folylpolyglutamate synthase